MSTSTQADLQGELNRLAETSGLGEDGAANSWAGTTGLATVAALNEKAGNSFADYLDLDGVCNQLAGTSGLAAPGALQTLDPVSGSSLYAATYGATYT